jgi:hypothetical protein
MKKLNLCFIYPHCGGGSWLSNLIGNLENNTKDIPKVSLVFDLTDKSEQVKVMHAFEYYDITSPTLMERDNSCSYELFSMDAPFNLFLNEVHKGLDHPPDESYKVLGITSRANIDDIPLSEKFEKLTCTAKAHISDDYFASIYRQNISLDSQLIYTDKDKFIDRLFYILDQYNISYVKDRDYCYASIMNYRSTCLNPKDIIGNMTNICWLSWCHALLMLHKISLPVAFNFITADNLEEISNALMPVQSQCIELTKQYCFEWNE